MRLFDGKKFAAMRKAAGYSQKKLAESLGTYEQHVQRWEYGKLLPTANYLLNAIILLNCSPADLLTDEPTE